MKKTNAKTRTGRSGPWDRGIWLFAIIASALAAVAVAINYEAGDAGALDTIGAIGLFGSVLLLRPKK